MVCVRSIEIPFAMGIHARRGPASHGSKQEAGDGQNGIDDDKMKTKKKGNTINRQFLALWRKHGSTIKSPTFASALLLLVVVFGVNNGLPRFAEDVTEGLYTKDSSPIRRLHTVSYFDVYTNTIVTRTIQLAAPHRQSSFKSFNYVETESAPWFDFNLPDQASAFKIRHNRQRQCYPMAPWQTTIHQACNHFHEQETAEHHTMLMRFINCGENRCTFLLNNGGETYVLKTLFLGKPSRDYPNFFGGPERYLMATKDSLALEKLTSSPYVVNLYASCALAQIVEYSSGGNIHDLLKRSRQRKQLDALARNSTKVEYSKNIIQRQSAFKNSGKKRHHVHENQQSALTQKPGSHDERFMYISQLSKLKIAYHVATAVADMHALEDHPYSLPSMSHNDLCCHQFMLVDGVYKLGDFDWATILTQTKPATSSSSSSSSSLRSRQESPPDLCQTTPLRMTSDYLKGLAPEELVYYEDMEDAFAEEGYAGETYEATRVYRDKLDVYQVGSIIYTLLTYLWIWEGHGTYEAIVAVVHVSICRP